MKRTRAPKKKNRGKTLSAVNTPRTRPKTVRHIKNPKGRAEDGRMESGVGGLGSGKKAASDGVKGGGGLKKKKKGTGSRGISGALAEKSKEAPRRIRGAKRAQQSRNEGQAQ